MSHFRFSREVYVEQDDEAHQPSSLRQILPFIGRGYMTDTTQEKALIEAAKQDPKDFDVLYARYAQRIYQYAFAQLHDAEEAADAMQQAFLRAWQSLQRYQADYPFAAWLFGIARNVIMHIRAARAPAISWDSIGEQAHPSSVDGNPETVALLHEAQNHIQQLLYQLPPEKQELLALYRDKELSIAEIALILGKNPEAVRKQLTRILKTLREQYHAFD
jgi:RNA polymerase sigma-70 factor, ECF subfamily